MDHNLDDSLNLEGDMEMETVTMDFDHSVDVVNQEDIPLEGSKLEGINMEMDDIEGHTLMDTGNSEVTVSDFIDDQFPYQEYTIQHEGSSGSNITINPNQLNQQTITQPLFKIQKAESLLKVSNAVTSNNMVTFKMAQPKSVKRTIAAAPRQVAIAPKPAVQYAIAPKPVALFSNTGNITKKDDKKSGKVITQIGNQLVMMPKKIKLVSAESGTSGVQYAIQRSTDQTQVVGNKAGKPLLKFIQLQGQSSAEQTTNSAVLTRAPSTARYVMQQKTVPISIAGTKVAQNIKIGPNKQQIIAIKSQNPKVVSGTQATLGTNKVLITPNSNPKLLIRTSAPTSTTQVIKDQLSHTQYHPINVPGKGIQYIKLVTNQLANRPTVKPVTLPAKNYVLTDKKGNVIQMKTEKMGAQQPLPIVISGTAAANKGTFKTQRKLVRIAPVTKPATHTITQPARSSQSLLASTSSMSTPVATTSDYVKISPTPSTSDAVEGVTLEAYNEMVDQNLTEETLTFHDYSEAPLEETMPDDIEHEETVDIKPTLQSLIADAVSESAEESNAIRHQMEIEIDMDKTCIRNMLRDVSNSNMENNRSIANANEESVIIVPGSRHNDTSYSDESQSKRYSAEERDSRLISVECDPYSLSQSSPQPSPSDQIGVDLGMRPRKPCNCTKSQCLKLYCDCFANGEFCNQCNCNNCHNNLENEDVRQKAIRSCLERNPNAFRPKIGKSKTGVDGPEIIRRHTKGCNCKRSGCLKKYCECYEAKIACTAMCKCVGCRNVEATLVRRRDAMRLREKLTDSNFRPQSSGPAKQPCSFMTTEVIEAVCQCLVACASETDDSLLRDREIAEPDPVQDVIEEFARCLQDVIAASHHQL